MACRLGSLVGQQGCPQPQPGPLIALPRIDASHDEPLRVHPRPSGLPPFLDQRQKPFCESFLVPYKTLARRRDKRGEQPHSSLCDGRVRIHWSGPLPSLQFLRLQASAIAAKCRSLHHTHLHAIAAPRSRNRKECSRSSTPPRPSPAGRKSSLVSCAASARRWSSSTR